MIHVIGSINYDTPWKDLSSDEQASQHENIQLLIHCVDPALKKSRYHLSHQQVAVAIARLEADTPQALVLHVQIIPI